MSKLGFMMDRALGPDDVPILVDLGYDGPDAVERWESLRAAGIGHRNFSLEGHRRLLMRLPIKKAKVVLAAFPIVEGKTYWQTTHHWVGLAQGETIAPIPEFYTAGEQTNVPVNS